MVNSFLKAGKYLFVYVVCYTALLICFAVCLPNLMMANGCTGHIHSELEYTVEDGEKAEPCVTSYPCCRGGDHHTPFETCYCDPAGIETCCSNETCPWSAMDVNDCRCPFHDDYMFSFYEDKDVKPIMLNDIDTCEGCGYPWYWCSCQNPPVTNSSTISSDTMIRNWATCPICGWMTPDCKCTWAGDSEDIEMLVNGSYIPGNHGLCQRCGQTPNDCLCVSPGDEFFSPISSVNPCISERKDWKRPKRPANSELMNFCGDCGVRELYCECYKSDLGKADSPLDDRKRRGRYKTKFVSSVSSPIINFGYCSICGYDLVDCKCIWPTNLNTEQIEELMAYTPYCANCGVNARQCTCKNPIFFTPNLLSNAACYPWPNMFGEESSCFLCGWPMGECTCPFINVKEDESVDAVELLLAPGVNGTCFMCGYTVDDCKCVLFTHDDTCCYYCGHLVQDCTCVWPTVLSASVDGVTSASFSLLCWDCGNSYDNCVCWPQHASPISTNPDETKRGKHSCCSGTHVHPEKPPKFKGTTLFECCDGVTALHNAGACICPDQIGPAVFTGESKEHSHGTTRCCTSKEKPIEVDKDKIIRQYTALPLLANGNIWSSFSFNKVPMVTLCCHSYPHELKDCACP